MTAVGLVGGLGPESTIDYYRRILDAWKLEDPSTAPSIIIDSLDVQRALRLVASDRAALIDYLLASLNRLAAAGADVIAMTANTPHIVFDELAARSRIPLVSIVEVCAEEAKRRGLRRVALLGTRFTMDAPFYPDVLRRHGIDVVVPDEADRAWVHDRYIGELLKGEFRDETRRELTSLVAHLRAERRIDGIVLGGTELPLLLASPTIAEVPALDTTALHVAAIVANLRAGGSAAPRRIHDFTLEPIGRIRSTLQSLDDAPRQGDEGAPDAWLDVTSAFAGALRGIRPGDEGAPDAWLDVIPAFAGALRGIRPGDELMLLTWLHRADRQVLEVHPRDDPNRPLAGVFATRSPDRPNPLGLHRVTVREMSATGVRIGPIEVIDGTPVVDIKPVLGSER